MNPTTPPPDGTPADPAGPTRIEVFPILAPLSRFMPVPVGGIVDRPHGESDSYILRHAEPPTGFTLELLYRARRPYTIYLIAHALAAPLVGRQATVLVTATTGTWRSAPLCLQVGARLPVADDAGFGIHQVRTVTLELL